MPGESCVAQRGYVAGRGRPGVMGKARVPLARPLSRQWTVDGRPSVVAPPSNRPCSLRGTGERRVAART